MTKNLLNGRVTFITGRHMHSLKRSYNDKKIYLFCKTFDLLPRSVFQSTREHIVP